MLSPREPEHPRRTLAEEVYRSLRAEILTLRRRPGESLGEQELAERYGASRVPVREALRRLAQEGLVKAVPYKGYSVSPISLREIHEAFELRQELERFAVERAVERATDDDLARLRGLAAAQYVYDDQASWTEFLSRNLEFHSAVAALSGNGRLARLIHDLVEGMQRYFFLGLTQGDHATEMREEHERLIAALAARSRDRAIECVREQIERSRRRILDGLFRQASDLPVE